MSKDLVLDRFGRFYEFAQHLARLGHSVRGYTLDYHEKTDGVWQHGAAPGSLIWESQSLGKLPAMSVLRYPWQLLRRLEDFAPDFLIGASDIPQLALTAWLSGRLNLPFAVDLYDNFEGYGQARLPGFRTALRWAVRRADLVTVINEPLKQKVVSEYSPLGTIVIVPNAPDGNIFRPSNKATSRRQLGLPSDALLIGTAGALYRQKGLLQLYAAWDRISESRPDVHLVLAGPVQADLPPPKSDRVHYLGCLDQDQVARLFSALDVGVVTVLDSPFGRYCSPQKAYEMLGCRLPVVAADVGAVSVLFSQHREHLYDPGDDQSLARAICRLLDHPAPVHLSVPDWQTVVAEMAQDILQAVERKQLRQ